MVVAGGGLGAYFAFSHSTAAAACGSGGGLTSSCVPSSTLPSSPISPTHPSSSVPTTTSPVPTTTSPVPTTTTPIPTTTSPVPTTTTVPPPPPSGGTTVNVGSSITLTYPSDWTEASGSSQGFNFDHSNPVAAFHILVGTTQATTASAIGQNYLSGLGQNITNLQVTDQGTGSTGWSTLTQFALYTITGSITSAQSSSPVFGQVWAMLNPQTHIGAEISGISDTSADYSAVQTEVHDMVTSLADGT